jgi:hypothetical protein
MAALVTIWNNRISPVFDVASQGLILNKSNDSVETQFIKLPEIHPIEKLVFIKSLDIQDLICGAINFQAEKFALSRGLNIFSFKSGEIEQIIIAWLKNDLNNPLYSMPGCRKRRNCSGYPNKGHKRRGQFNNHYYD